MQERKNVGRGIRIKKDFGGGGGVRKPKGASIAGNSGGAWILRGVQKKENGSFCLNSVGKDVGGKKKNPSISGKKGDLGISQWVAKGGPVTSNPPRKE